MRYGVRRKRDEVLVQIDQVEARFIERETKALAFLPEVEFRYRLEAVRVAMKKWRRCWRR